MSDRCNAEFKIGGFVRSGQSDAISEIFGKNTGNIHKSRIDQAPKDGTFAQIPVESVQRDLIGQIVERLSELGLRFECFVDSNSCESGAATWGKDGKRFTVPASGGRPCVTKSALETAVLNGKIDSLLADLAVFDEEIPKLVVADSARERMASRIP